MALNLDRVCLLARASKTRGINQNVRYEYAFAGHADTVPVAMCDASKLEHRARAGSAKRAAIFHDQRGDAGKSAIRVDPDVVDSRAEISTALVVQSRLDLQTVIQAVIGHRQRDRARSGLCLVS